jgi:hypothetical protein
MANVRARIKIVSRVSVINDKTDPQNRPPTEGDQWGEKEEFVTKVMTVEEWKLAIAFIKFILQTQNPQ